METIRCLTTLQVNGSGEHVLEEDANVVFQCRSEFLGCIVSDCPCAPSSTLLCHFIDVAEGAQAHFCHLVCTVFILICLQIPSLSRLPLLISRLRLGWKFFGSLLRRCHFCMISSTVHVWIAYHVPCCVWVSLEESNSSSRNSLAKGFPV